MKKFKNLMLGLTLGLVFMSFSSYAQITVVASGKVIAGGSDPDLANFKTLGDSELECAFDAATGFPDMTWQLAGITKGQVKYNSTQEGLLFSVDQNSTTNFGLTNNDRSLFLDGQNQRVGIKTVSPSQALHVSGNVLATGSFITSDKRLKEDITKYSRGLDEILKLNVVSYKYNERALIDDNDETHVGILAQEFQEIAPELVGTFTHEVWEDGADGESSELVSSEDFLYVNASSVQWMLVNAVKQQQEMLDAKDERISDLETKMAKLEELVTLAIETGNTSTTINNSEITLEFSEVAELGQNRPNPFNGVTKVDYNVPTNAVSASINIFNVEGKLMKSVTVSHTGLGVLTINADEIPSGTYSYQLVVDGQIVDAKKMVLQN